MVSADRLRTTMNMLMGDCVPQDFPYENVAETMRAFEDANGITLSEYGYVMWAIDHCGTKCAYRNLMASHNIVKGYMDDAFKYREDMPAMLVNAHKYVTKLLSNVADFDTCLTMLEGMSYPYILYTLFAGSGQRELVMRYRPEMEEQLKRYPSTLDKLPESYRNVGKEVLNEDVEQS